MITEFLWEGQSQDEEVKWFSIDDVLEGCKHRDGTFCVPMEGLETVMKHLGYDQA
ncbi:hypothetical protein [Butyrivibrio sp. AC2005]|uniref:hypothetical protein n=1 Tax=Butyrivibrio sp. AC2005 TaxID=1280672 RepID=UPI0004261B30|nr:hypothetical protein [Butyrivibrio sp. AC2005]